MIEPMAVFARVPVTSSVPPDYFRRISFRLMKGLQISPAFHCIPRVGQRNRSTSPVSESVSSGPAQPESRSFRPLLQTVGT